MQIHTVKQGDTIFNIARMHSTSPMKIIENNALTNPDRLAIGQKLLILTPTRTYNVRGGDTLYKIAKRFGVKYDELLANNPYLAGTDRIYPGQILTVKKDSAPFGIGSAVGYYYRGCPEEKLSLSLPYLTHIAISSAKRTKNGIKTVFDGGGVVKKAKEAKKIPLLRVYDEEETTSSFDENYIDALIKLALKGGYHGICMAAYKIQKSDDAAYTDFLLKLKKKCLEKELQLFSEIDGNARISPANDAADGVIMFYDKCALEDIPSFEDGEHAAYSEAAKVLEPSKIYIDLSPFGYVGSEPLLREEIHRLAYTQGSEIMTDEKRGISYFNHNIYKSGDKTEAKVIFEDLENIKARLNLAGELGFMGISFDIMRVPTEYLMMFSSIFALPDYSLL